MQTFKIKPQKGLMVRDPENREPLKSAGEDKPRNTYWLRRVKEGSVLVMETKKTPSAKEAQS